MQTLSRTLVVVLRCNLPYGGYLADHRVGFSPSRAAGLARSRDLAYNSAPSGLEPLTLLPS